jgi:hypothetical protein
VKARLLVAGDRRSHYYSPFRSWDFHACVFVLLDAHTYDVTSAIEVPVAGVQALSRETAWVKAFRVGTRAQLHNVQGAIDLTAEVRRVLEAMGDTA